MSWICKRIRGVLCTVLFSRAENKTKKKRVKFILSFCIVFWPGVVHTRIPTPILYERVCSD